MADATTTSRCCILWKYSEVNYLAFEFIQLQKSYSLFKRRKLNKDIHVTFMYIHKDFIGKGRFLGGYWQFYAFHQYNSRVAVRYQWAHCTCKWSRTRKLTVCRYHCGVQLILVLSQLKAVGETWFCTSDKKILPKSIVLVFPVWHYLSGTHFLSLGFKLICTAGVQKYILLPVVCSQPIYLSLGWSALTSLSPLSPRLGSVTVDHPQLR